MFSKIWNVRCEGLKTQHEKRGETIATLDTKISVLIKRIVDSTSDRVISAYEKEIDSLEAQKRLLTDQAEHALEPSKPFETAFRAAMEFLSSPWKLWESGDYQQKRLLLKLAVPNPIPYCKENGFSNREFSLPFSILGGMHMQKNKLVGPEGFEPPT